MENYSRLDKLLHRVALGSPILSESLFDIEKALYLSKAKADAGKRSVYVLGLARAGTTTLMRELHASGAFASLTYQDMPFVMAPNLWRVLTSSNRKRTARAERAHGDGIIVDSDSPEALEEVFWKTFHGSDYIGKTVLTPHSPSPETLNDFERYQRLVCLRYDKSRYLSKNNNNILRIRSLAKRFPKAHFFVMFRDPVTHAQSLMKQHQRFSGSSPFVRDYMAWLAHHEFGDNHRPFSFSKGFMPPGKPDSLEYWLMLWHNVYQHLATVVKIDRFANIHLVCYETLCTQSDYWAKVCKTADIPPGNSEFRLSKQPKVSGLDDVILKEVSSLYDEMVSLDRFASKV